MKRWWILLGLGIALGSVLMTMALNIGGSAIAQERTTVSFTPQERATIVSLESALTRIAETVQPTVVHIRATRQIGRSNSSPDEEDSLEFFFGGRGMPRVEGQGSGVIIRSDGYIITNDHVVDGATEVEVTFHDGSKAKGTVLRAPSADIALVKVNRTGLPTAVLGDSSKVKPGQIAFAIGSPFGLENTFTMGIISAVGRREAIGGMTGRTRFYPDLIQTDAAINSGNSGGPLVNSQGEVIGINTAIVAGRFTGGNVGIGFAIPINRVKTVVNQLLEKGTYQRGYLGVGLRDLTPDEREAFNVTQGVLIGSVQEGTPADKAGLQPGDVVIEADGKPVKGEIELRDIIANKGPNSRLSLKVLRDGKPITVEATLGVHPEDDPEQPSQQTARQQETRPLERLGITIGEIPANLREQFGNQRGAYITRVAPDSPASDQLQPGDLIVRANGVPINSADDLERALSRVQSGEMVRLVVVRRSGEDTVRELVMFRMP